MATEFHLDRAQQTSPVWHVIKAHYEERLACLRLQNDNSNLDELATAALRARIAEVKSFLSLDQEPPTQEG